MGWSLLGHRNGRNPVGCFAKGVRAEGSTLAAFAAMVRVVGTDHEGFHCIPNGSGFFTCHWTNTPVGTHTGTVVFKPQPVVKILSYDAIKMAPRHQLALVSALRLGLRKVAPALQPLTPA